MNDWTGPFACVSLSFSLSKPNVCKINLLALTTKQKAVWYQNYHAISVIVSYQHRDDELRAFLDDIMPTKQMLFRK